jgi:hypothetical protein
MSGLEPLLALSLACNVMQVIDIAFKTTSTCKAIFQSGSLDPTLTRTVAQLMSIFQRLGESLDSATQPRNRDEQALLDVARECSAAAADLKAEVVKISDEASKGKYSGAIGGAMKAIFKRRKIEKLEKSLAACKEVLETHLLVQI